MNDTKRIRRGQELSAVLTTEQHVAVDSACERVRMGESGYWHEIAELVIERDSLKANKRTRVRVTSGERKGELGWIDCSSDGFHPNPPVILDSGVRTSWMDKDFEIVVGAIEQRKDVLLRAAYDILKRSSGAGYLVHYDGTNCDGYCLMSDIAIELKLKEGTGPIPLS